MADGEEQVFIFGYGSLMCADSRARSGDTGVALPVIVSGVARSWSARIDLDKLGAVKNELIRGVTAVSVKVCEPEEGRCSGVIVQIPPSQLSKFDAREIGYSRIQIPLDRISLLEEEAETELKSNAVVWVYVANEFEFSNARFPLIQSYIDVILKGCADISEDFLEQFIKTTDGWEEAAAAGAWLDDRSCPGYVRADDDAMVRGANEWDILLGKHLPSCFSSRIAVTTTAIATPEEGPGL